MSDGPVVPPYLDRDWRVFRAHMRQCAAHAEAAADSSTLEDAQVQTNLAHIEIERANFALETIRRKEASNGRNKE